MGERKSVVITGTGVISPIGIGTERFWSNLVSGVSGIAAIQSFDPEGFPCRIAAEARGFDPLNHLELKESRKLDRFIQFSLSASAMAIGQARLLEKPVNPERIGVYIGSGVGGLRSIEKEQMVLAGKGPRRIDPYLVPKLIINLASGQTAIKYGYRGPNIGIATACATGLHAVGESYWMIQRGDADIMITGGTEACITPLCLAAFASMRALSTNNDRPSEASRPFDLDRDGFVIGEGAGILVIESLESARKRNVPILAEIAGYGLNADAFHITAPREDGSCVARCMELALERTGIDRGCIGYINAHGTSTPLNDIIETRAIKTVFGDSAYNLPISSTKSMIGHLLGAAGGVELVATIMTLLTGTIHPTINHRTPDPQCDLDYVPNTARAKDIQYAMCNSCGFGGTNAVIILKRWD